MRLTAAPAIPDDDAGFVPAPGGAWPAGPWARHCKPYGVHIHRDPREHSVTITGELVRNPKPVELGESDATLVAAAVAGDHPAKQALFQRHALMVNRLARRLLGPGVDANDLVQDAFVEALQNIHRLKNGQAFQSWLCSIVVRTAYKVRRRRRILERLGLLRHQPLEMDTFCSPAAPPDIAVELRAVYAMLHDMPVEMHIALVLRRVEGLSVEDIAGQMRLSVSTVKRRLTAAEKRLDAWTATPGGSS